MSPREHHALLHEGLFKGLARLTPRKRPDMSCGTFCPGTTCRTSPTWSAGGPKLVRDACGVGATLRPTTRRASPEWGYSGGGTGRSTDAGLAAVEVGVRARGLVPLRRPVAKAGPVRLRHRVDPVACMSFDTYLAHCVTPAREGSSTRTTSLASPCVGLPLGQAPRSGRPSLDLARGSAIARGIGCSLPHG